MNCCGRVVPCKSSIVTRAVYAVMFLLTAVAAWILGNWGYDLLQFVPELKECGTNVACYAVYSVYRVTFGLCCFHILFALLLIGVSSQNDFRFFIQGGSLLAWLVKVVLWLGAMVGMFFVPNVVFYYFAWISVFGACIFLLIQILLLIEFAYEWNESWVAKWHGETFQENKNWFRILLAVTIGLLIATVGLTVVMYVFFGKDIACGLNIFFITFNFCLCVIVAICAVLPKVQDWNPKSGLLQAAVCVLYATYLVWSAIMSEPSSTCNSLTGSTGADEVTIIIGAIFTFVAVVYSTVRAGSSSADTLKGKMPSVNESKKDIETGSHSSKDDDSSTDDADVGLEYNYTFFHLSFALGAMYICMLMTNWIVIGGTGGTLSIDSGMASVWVKIATGWVVLALYTWTVFAPKILSGRDFS